MLKKSLKLSKIIIMLLLIVIIASPKVNAADVLTKSIIDSAKQTTGVFADNALKEAKGAIDNYDNKYGSSIKQGVKQSEGFLSGLINWIKDFFRSIFKLFVFDSKKDLVSNLNTQIANQSKDVQQVAIDEMARVANEKMQGADLSYLSDLQKQTSSSNSYEKNKKEVLNILDDYDASGISDLIINPSLNTSVKDDVYKR